MTGHAGNSTFRIRLLSGIVVVIVVAASIAVKMLMPNTSQRDLDVIRECSNGQEAITCARPHVQSLLAREASESVMEIFSKEFDAQRCHYLGHLVGQLLYHRYGDTEPAIASCNSVCDFACTHGVVGEAFMSEAGFNAEMFDPKHLTGAQIKQTGRKLCVSWSGCHAVGHALYQYYRDFEPALSVCTAISSADRRINCYRGIFMEYGDALRSTSVWAASSPMILADPDTYCKKFEPSVRRACYWYMPATFSALLKAKGLALGKSELLGRISKNCIEISSKMDRDACLFGIGVFQYNLAFTDMPAAHSLCDAFRDSGRAACRSGILWMVMEYHKSETALQYCAQIVEPAEKRACYDELFKLVGQVNLSPSSVKSRCAASESLCLQAADAMPGQENGTTKKFDGATFDPRGI